MYEPGYTPKERRADAFIHCIGVLFAIGAVAALIAYSWGKAGPVRQTALALYSTGLLATVCFSAAYNLTRHPQWKPVLRRLDHAAIFIMIAGTYTPFAMVAMPGRWGTALLSVVWLLALSGAALKLFWHHRFQRYSVIAYLALGWIVLFALEPLIAAVSRETILLLAVGGILYTLGVVFHLWESLPYQNAIWHGMVLIAAISHFAAIMIEVVP